MARGKSVVQMQSGHRARVPALAPLGPPRSRARTIAYVAERYGWDPARVDRGILPLADHFGATTEVFYRDPQNYREVTVVWITRAGPERYEIREENRPARLARDPRTRYTTVVPINKAVPTKIAKEATDMAARRGAKPKAAAPEPEPEVEDVVEDEELDEDEDDEAEDEAEESEDEDDEEQDEDDEADEDEDDEDEDEEEEAKDYSAYAGKSPTPTMEDFGVWLLAEVYSDEYPGDEDSFLEGVRLGGTLRMEFQRSEFCKERRAERQQAIAEEKAARARKATAKEKEAEEPPAKATKTATKSAKPATKAAAAPAKAAKPATKAVPGKPAGRTADRPATKAATTAKAAAPTRRGKATAEAPF